MNNIWKETIGNTPEEDFDLKDKTIRTLKTFEENKKEVESENKKYALIWNSLSNEQKKKINEAAAEIVKTRPFPDFELTIRFVKYELLDKIKGV